MTDAKLLLDPLVDRAARATRAAYGKRARIRSKMVQHAGELPRLVWWVDTGDNRETLAADTLELLVRELEKKAALTASKKEKKMETVAVPDASAERLLGTKQAGAYMGVTASSVANWAKAKRIKFTLVRGQSATGRQYRFTRAALDDYMAVHKIVHRKSPRKHRVEAVNKSEARESHPQMNGDVRARVAKIAAALAKKATLTGIEVRVSPTAVYQAALKRGLEVLEKEIKS